MKFFKDWKVRTHGTNKKKKDTKVNKMTLLVSSIHQTVFIDPFEFSKERTKQSR